MVEELTQEEKDAIQHEIDTAKLQIGISVFLGNSATESMDLEVPVKEAGEFIAVFQLLDKWSVN